MGLERLSSGFNNLEENRRDDTVSDNLFNHTFGSNYAHEDIIEITKFMMQIIDNFALKKKILSCNFLYVDHSWVAIAEGCNCAKCVNQQSLWMPG